MAKTINATPTWSAIIGLHLEVLQNPKAKDKSGAIAEIMRLAKFADDINSGFANGDFIEMPDSLRITDERRFDMLVGAIEGGSNYWYYLDEDATKIIYKYKPEDGQTFVSRAWAAIKAGEEIPVTDTEAEDDEDKILGHISLDSIKKGEVKMLAKQNKHYMDIVNKEDDAITADIWFQYAVMGEIVFG